MRVKELPIRDVVVAETDLAFDRCFKATQMPDPDPNATWESTYGLLDEKIKKTLQRILGLRWETDFYTDGSWFSNCTRYFECSQAAVSARLVDIIQSLLQEEFADWKVQFVIYNRYPSGGELLGSMVVYREWLLIDHSVRHLVENDVSLRQTK